MTDLRNPDRASLILQADAIAVDPRRFGVPLTQRTCNVCGGIGIAIRKCANEIAGVHVDDPCPMCRGYGVYWDRGPANFIRTVDDLIEEDSRRDTAA